jgi:hypothetical protein
MNNPGPKNEIHKEQLIQNISKLQEQYYEHNPKNTFFKSNQKFECAKQVIQNVDVQQLIRHSFFLIPNTNRIFFDYPLFKTFACAEVYEEFTTHSYAVLFDCISQNSSFEMHVNMNSFTISAFERLRKLIERFFTESPMFSDKLTYVYIYYTPSVIEQINKIIKMFIAHISYKIVYFSKAESEEKLKLLFSGNYAGHSLETK